MNAKDVTGTAVQPSRNRHCAWLGDIIHNVQVTVCDERSAQQQLMEQTTMNQVAHLA
jgi:hypothetical protein